jgi:hypothetical protein
VRPLLRMVGPHANKVVFCEWPLGAALAEAQEMATYAKARGTRLRLGHGIRGRLRSRGDASQADRRDRALGR